MNSFRSPYKNKFLYNNYNLNTSNNDLIDIFISTDKVLLGIVSPVHLDQLTRETDIRHRRSNQIGLNEKATIIIEFEKVGDV